MMLGSNQQSAAAAAAAAAAEEEAELARKHTAAVATSRQWSAQTESRIVRVSRVFGGKDRHSKVKTVKGLRDRRVRLSVPTAIQLYDLQDRLGLNQPSKVVDWLLNAARHEIDKLPPLQFPPQDLCMGHHHHLPSPMPLMHHHHDEKYHVAAAAALAADKSAGGGGDDVDGGSGGVAHMGRFPAGGYHRFMGLNNPLGMVNSAGGMPFHYTGSHHHQLVFYSSEAEQFTVDNLGSQSLSLSSARAFHDQTGS
ncbi:uncharacterized protein LOC102705387 isoform X2 [Oryza brachyantha]|uniref:uncharacterized protein LOC102705387 isoform X2 n=1 Tax=Oryza brachyantha TaxID=4533 RepID=UPI001ADCB413|nr:uncharacterized protein LOC102705387 isoform X2 [Oryza brachyantha]